VAAQSAANIEPIAAGDHDIKQKQRGRLTLGVGNQVSGSLEEASCKPRCLKVMLHEPRNIGVVFQYKYGLAQPVLSSPAAIVILMRRPHGIVNRLLHGGK
jgi:hypothetical protein